jgi:exonuclease V gamma subunit
MCVITGGESAKKAITFFVGNNLNMPKTALMIFKEIHVFYVFFAAAPPLKKYQISLINKYMISLV